MGAGAEACNRHATASRMGGIGASVGKVGRVVPHRGVADGLVQVEAGRTDVGGGGLAIL